LLLHFHPILPSSTDSAYQAFGVGSVLNDFDSSTVVVVAAAETHSVGCLVHQTSLVLVLVAANGITCLLGEALVWREVEEARERQREAGEVV
jgi:hypothetical protein